MVLSTLAIDYFFLPPIGHLAIQQPIDQVQLSTFFGITSVISWLCNSLKHSQRQITRLSQQLVQEKAESLQLALQASEARFQAFMNHSPAASWIVDTEGIMVYASQTYLRMFQLPTNDLVGKSIFDLYPLAVAQQFLDNIQTVGRTGEVLQVIEVAPRPDGTLGDFLVYKFLIAQSPEQTLVGGVAIDVTQQHQTQAALRKSEERLRLALDLTQLGFWDMNLATGQTISNENYFTLLGLTPNQTEASHEVWRSRVHPEDIDWVEQRFFTAIQNQTAYTAEYRVVYPDGSVHWLLSRAQGIYDDREQPLRAIGVFLDISDRKQAEVVLQQQARQEQLLWSITQSIRQSLDLNAILNAAVTEVRQLLQVDRVAVYRFNPDWSGTFIAESASENGITLMGLASDWKDTYLQEIQGGCFRTTETLVISDVHTSGLPPRHIEILEQFHVRAYAVAPIFVGEALWGLLAIYHNTTTHPWQAWEVDLLKQIANQLSIAIQQAELYRQLQSELQERKQTEIVLREAERRWRSLLENVQLIVIGLDRSGTVNYANPFFLNLTGYTESEVLGTPWFENFLPPADQQIVQSAFARGLLNKIDPHYQNPILTKFGEERLIAWNNTELRNSAGTIIGTISIGEDITEWQKLEQIKNEFIGIVSHELRTPLTAIQMSLGLLKAGVYQQNSDKFRRMIEIALLDTSRLVNLVNDILDLERLKSGQVTLEKAVCSAAALMQQAVDGVQAIAAEHQIHICITPTEAVVWAAADAMIQTLTNLLSNAIKFSPAQSTIDLSAQRQSDMMLFQVRDSGRGIPANKLETIFERFQQVDASDSRQKGGTGLGLAICRSIIEQHGGKIWAESTLGKGSTFCFTLPLPPENLV